VSKKHPRHDATFDAESGIWTCNVCGRKLKTLGGVDLHFERSQHPKHVQLRGADDTSRRTGNGQPGYSWRPLRASNDIEQYYRRLGWTHVCSVTNELGKLVGREILTEEQLRMRQHG